jgi:hypothetical protein
MPIHGEKTNILFHPTPSISYEPMFARLEKQAGGVCMAVFGAIIVLGRMFGASIWGLIPLAACITSGIWLWMKEVIRSGREVEWHSEKERGEYVSSIQYPWPINFHSLVTGNRKPASRVGRMAECHARNWLGPCEPRYVPSSCRHIGRCHVRNLVFVLPSGIL